MTQPLPRRIKNSDAANFYLPTGKVEMAKGEGDLPRVKIRGYSGNAVDLNSYYIEDPVVYAIDGIEVRNKLPYLLDHKDSLGHTESVTKTDNSVDAEAVHSFPSQQSKDVAGAINNGMTYQASMGLHIEPENVTFHQKGSVVVNGKTFQAPIYVVHKSKLVELSATLFGRDEETEVTKLAKDTFMTIKNSVVPPKGSPAPKNPITNNADPKEGDEGEGNDDGKGTGTTVNNSTTTTTLPPQENKPGDLNLIRNSLRWQMQYKDHPELVLNAIDNGWDDDRLKREVEIKEIQNGYPKVPSIHTVDNKVENSFLARMALSHNVSPEFLSKKLGEKAVDVAMSQGTMGLREMLMYVANSEGGRFNGHSDVNEMCRFLKQRVNNMQWSTIDFPNLMHRITEFRIEDAWTIDEPFAPTVLREVQNKDFKPTGHLRAAGGSMWEKVNNEGKIRHGSVGTESTYETKLDTIGQILVFKREDIINDDIGWIDETLDLMIDGARMYPDFQWVNKIYTGLSRSWLTSGTNHFTLPLTKDNLRTVYNAVRKRNITKGDKTVKGSFSTRWMLVIPEDLEETAWEILKVDRYAGGTAAEVPERNYWFNRLDIKVFPQLDNTTYNSGARSDAWGILPANRRLMPYVISYLNGQRRPRTEVVDLPGDMLGFGVRGYWDVNVDEARPEAVAWSIPTT